MSKHSDLRVPGMLPTQKRQRRGVSGPSISSKQAVRQLRKAGYRLEQEKDHWLVYGEGEEPLVRLPMGGQGKTLIPVKLQAVHRLLEKKP